MQHLINQLYQTVGGSKKTIPNSHFYSLYMKLHQIKCDDGIFFAYGIDLLSMKNVRVRLNTIEEGAQDLVITKRASNMFDSRIKITTMYKTRQTLEAKDKKLNSQYLFFERAVPLNDEPDSYRANWCYSMSQQSDVEMVIGHMNLKYRAPTPNNPYPQKTIAYAQAIQFMREFTLSNTDNNLKMLHFALMNSGKGMVREGAFHALIKHNNNTIAEFKILQHYDYLNGQDQYGRAIQYLSPVTSEESIQHYINKKEQGPINSFLLSKDIGRIVLQVFCGYDINQQLFSSDAPEYLNQITDIKNKLISGEYNVVVFGLKIYRFGPETMNSLAPKGNFNPLVHYTEKPKQVPHGEHHTPMPTYLPTVLILHKTINQRRYIAYHDRLHYNVIGEGTPLPLTEFNSEVQPMDHSITALQYIGSQT